MSGHSRPSGGPSQRLDTRRSQIRGIVDEPQNCRLKAKIIETQSGERPQWTENQKEGRPDRKKPGERDLHRVRYREKQRDLDMQRDRETPREILRSKERNRDAESHGNRETQSAQCLHTARAGDRDREAERQRQRERETERGQERETERESRRQREKTGTRDRD